MAEEKDKSDYTNLNFLTRLKSPPKKKMARPLTINTDLQELDQILKSPRGTFKPKPPEPTNLDIQMTKRFVVELLKNYESEEQVAKKWQGFMKSVSNPTEFQQFVTSLKDIKENDKNQEAKPNPESNGVQPIEKQAENKGKQMKRVYSSKKLIQVKPEHKQQESRQKLKKAIRGELQEVKDLLLAGERFIRDA